MNRRQFLLGATTVVGGASLANNVILPESPFSESLQGEPAEILNGRYNSWSPDSTGPNDYRGRAMVDLKNIGNRTYDFQVKFTPIHKNGDELDTHTDTNTIPAMEYKKFTEAWHHDDSTKYVNSLRVEVLASDQKWFNGWEPITQQVYEF